MTQRTQQQRFSMFLTAIRANNLCKAERQNLSLLRATPVGKHIQPEIAQDSAIRLVDCFQRIYHNQIDIEKRKPALTCLLNGGNCEKQINEYAGRE